MQVRMVLETMERMNRAEMFLDVCFLRMGRRKSSHKIKF